MRQLTIILALIGMASIGGCNSILPSAHGQVANTSAIWTWTAPKDFTSGTPIPSTDAITYDVFVGTAGKSSESLTPVATGITADTWTGHGYAPGSVVCGVVTSVVNNIESAPSNEACKAFPDVPSPPTNLVVK